MFLLVIMLSLAGLFFVKFTATKGFESKSVKEKLVAGELEYKAVKPKKVHNRITVDVDKDDLVEWLEAHGSNPDLWHIIATNSDPDGMQNAYNWILKQPDCDAGTAAQIFHYSAPYEALEMEAENYSTHYRSTMYKNAKIAADRWTSNDFKTHRFSPNDVESSTTKEEFYRLEREAKEKFGEAPFSISMGLFDTSLREEPKTNYYYSDF